MSRRDASVTLWMLAAVALAAAAPVALAELVGGDAGAVVVSLSFVAGGILWSRKPISRPYRSTLERLHERGEIDVDPDTLEAHIRLTRRVLGWTATASGAVTLAFVLAAIEL